MWTISRSVGEDGRGTETKTRHILVGYMTTSSWRTRNNLQMRFELYGAITQRVMIIPYRRFGTTCRSHFQGKDRLTHLSLEDGTDRLSRIVGKQLPLILMYICPCIANISLKPNQQDATSSRSTYFFKLLYMFHAVPPPIIRSTKLYIQRRVLLKQYCCLLPSWMRWNWVPSHPW